MLAASEACAAAQAAHDAAVRRIAELRALLEPPDIVTEIKTPIIQRIGDHVAKLLHVDYRHERAVPDPDAIAEARVSLPDAEREEVLARKPLKDAKRALEVAKAAALAKRLPIATARVRERNAEFWCALDVARAAHDALIAEAQRCDALLGERRFADGELFWPELRGEAEQHLAAMMVPGRECLMDFRRRRQTAAGWLK